MLEFASGNLEARPEKKSKKVGFCQQKLQKLAV